MLNQRVAQGFKIVNSGVIVFGGYATFWAILERTDKAEDVIDNKKGPIENKTF